MANENVGEDGSTEGTNSYISDDECLTFTANHIESSESESAASSVTFAWYSANAVQFNKNDSGWEDYNANTPISLNEGEFVRFKGNGVKTNPSKHFSMTGSISASGCVDSLRLKSLEPTNANYGQIQGLANSYYYCMFTGCTSLTNAPELPATTLAEKCYYEMFKGCTSLTSAPELPATTLAKKCYYRMFSGCSSLNLSTTQEGDYVYSWTFKIKDGSYDFSGNMFSNTVTTDAEYVTLYSKYPLSASLRTVLTKEGTTLTSDTEKSSVKNGKLSAAMINVSAPNNIVSGSGGLKAFITLKKDDNNVASSKKFKVNVLNGKIVAENIDLFMNDQEGTAPDDASKTNITPGLYDAYMTFVAA